MIFVQPGFSRLKRNPLFIEHCNFPIAENAEALNSNFSCAERWEIVSFKYFSL